MLHSCSCLAVCIIALWPALRRAAACVCMHPQCLCILTSMGQTLCAPQPPVMASSTCCNPACIFCMDGCISRVCGCLCESFLHQGVVRIVSHLYHPITCICPSHRSQHGSRLLFLSVVYSVLVSCLAMCSSSRAEECGVDAGVLIGCSTCTECSCAAGPAGQGVGWLSTGAVQPSAAPATESCVVCW